MRKGRKPGSFSELGTKIDQTIFEVARSDQGMISDDEMFNKARKVVSL